MILYRCFPWDREVRAEARGGALWFPRMLQGDGRHDNPLLYGCLYVSASATASVVEQLSRALGRPLAPPALRRFGLPLALAELELSDRAELIDLDDPEVLVREGLRPSGVATHERARTQADAARLFEGHPQAAGLRWWSLFESLWPNVTLFDRIERSLRVHDVRPLAPTDDVVEEATSLLGLRVEAWSGSSSADLT